jgi:hypothetical protein
MQAQKARALMLFALLFLLPPSTMASGSDLGLVAPSPASAHAAADAPWFAAEVDTEGDTGQHVSVAYDPYYDATYVSYYDATNQALRIARDDRATSNCGPGDEWYCQTLDTSGANVGRYSSIAVRPDGGGMGIAYHDATNSSLKYLKFDNPRLWVYQVATIDRGIAPVSNTGLYPSLRYSDSDQPFIAYYFDNPGGVDALMLAYYSVASGNCDRGDLPDEWRCETIITGEGVGQYPSLVVQHGWDFHVAYYDRGNGDLWYATSVIEESGNCGAYGDDWVCYPVSVSGDVGKYTSMYVDSAGDYHIAYYDATQDRLMYAEKVFGSGNCGLGGAECVEIDAMPDTDYIPLGISIAEDAAGYPIIAYQGTTGLKVARPLDALGMPPGSGNCGPEVGLFTTWYCETIDPNRYSVPPWRNADYASIALDASGLATIAYYRLYTAASDGNLVIARQWLDRAFLPLVIR